MSNAGNKRKLGCLFFWLLILWASKEKELAEKAKRNGKYSEKYLLKIPVSAILALYIAAKLSINLAWILAAARMTAFFSTLYDSPPTPFS
jgi:hypothetical protein